MKLVLPLLVVVFGLTEIVIASKLHPTADTWNLTEYLKGTPDQIRKTLYADIVRLNQVIRTTSRKLEDSKADVENDRATCLRRCHESSTYRAAKVEKDDAEHDLVAARNGGTQSERLAASSRFNRAKGIIDKMESRALTEDQNLQNDQRRINEATAKLADEQKLLADAIAWKDQLLAACGNSLRLSWPLDTGAAGFLGTVKVQEVKDGAILAEYTAAEYVGQQDAGEGIATIRYIPHKVRVLAPVHDTTRCRAGSRVLLNKNFEVASTSTLGDETVYVLRLSPCDTDKLWQTLTAPLDEHEITKATGN